jgi:hypothetical protein
MQQQHVDLGDRRIAVWPEEQKVATRGDPTISAAHFADAETFHPRLIEGILAAAKDERRLRRYYPASGGTKIYHLEQWGLPELDLVSARACELFRRVLQSDTAVIDLSWANVYGRGDYAMAHSHERAVASIVYFVDLGDESPRDALSGRFAIVDPRIKHCAKGDSPRVIAPLLPKLIPGDMLIFPAVVVHSVNPYAGKRPRITLSWNIGREAVPGKPLPFEA